MLGFGQSSHGGYLKSYLRKDGFLVDFVEDFNDLGQSHDGLVKHFVTKAWLMFDTIKQLLVLLCCVLAISNSFI